VVVILDDVLRSHRCSICTQNDCHLLYAHASFERAAARPHAALVYAYFFSRSPEARRSLGPFHARDLIRLREWRAMPLSSLGYLLLWSLATRGDLFSLHLQLPLAQVRTLCPGWSSRKLRYLQCNEIATAWKEAENDANTDVGLWGAGSSGTHVHGAGPDGLAKLQS
jgi:hypothetical protein